MSQHQDRGEEMPQFARFGEEESSARRWRGLLSHRSQRHHERSVRPAAALERRKVIGDFLPIGESSAGSDPGQSRKPLVPRRSSSRIAERIGIMRSGSRSSRVNVGSRLQPALLLVQAVSAARAVEPKRPSGTMPGTFSFFNNGRSARGY